MNWLQLLASEHMTTLLNWLKLVNYFYRISQSNSQVNNPHTKLAEAAIESYGTTCS